MKAKRILALALVLVMLFSAMPMTAFATEGTERQVSVPQGEQPTVIHSADGEVPVEENWNEAYPYGTFAFGSFQADVGEAGAKTAEGEDLPDSILIPVYRLGGTSGRVTAKILFAPAITTDANGEGFVYDYAASAKDDLLVEFENPSPIAAYQPLGVPQWQLQMRPAENQVTADLSDMEPRDDETFPVGLSQPVEADSYRWQASDDGVWRDIHDLEEPVGAAVNLPWSLIWDFEENVATGTDIRCIYSVEGQYYCAESLLKDVYEPIEMPEPMPEDLDPEADPGYSRVEADETFGLYEFDLTFADGETVKYIRVSALNDESSELPELALFTITGCEGGELGGMCNTLTLMVSDNDKIGPSTLGFTEQAVTADRALLQAKVVVRREGDTSYNVTVHYETVDGTAKAGVDYAAASGELAFAGSLDEIEIPLELISNGETEDKSFDVILSAVQGDGTQDSCTLTVDRVTVTVTGKAKVPGEDGAGKNLASLLAENDGEEVADSVTVGKDSLLADKDDVLQGSTFMEAVKPVEAELKIESDARSHAMGAYYSFTRPSNYNNYWRDWEALLGEPVWYGQDIANTSQQYKCTGITYGDILSGDSNEIKENVSHNKSITTYQGTRSGYTAQLIDANFSGDIYFGRDSSNMPYPTGNYFHEYALDVEWQQVGFQETKWTEPRHRYLLPTVYLKTGNLDYDYKFDVDGDRTDKYPSYQTIRCYTDWSSGLGRFNKNVSDEGNGWCDDTSLSTDPSPYGTMFMGYGDDITINIDLTHKLAWIDDNTDSLKDLMTRISHVDIRRFQARRRKFTNKSISLVLYTANDLDEAGSAIPLSASSPVYTSLAPTVELTPDQSGVNSSGQLYAGSTLTVTPKKYKGFRVAENGVFMTNSSGEVVGTVKKSGNQYYVTMMWDGFRNVGLQDSYTLQVIYERSQTLTVDVVPSVPRIEGTDTIDSGKVNSTFEGFISNATCTYVKSSDGLISGGGTSYNAFDQIERDKELNASMFSNGSSQGTFVTNADFEYKNIQSINFHKDHEDIIVFNGRAYEGDETIVLTQDDLSRENLHIIYYNKDFRRSVSPMEVLIDSVELYYDGGGVNGQLDGTMNGNDFVPSDGDFYVDSLRGEYQDNSFRPSLGEDDQVHQYFFRVFYSIRPRSFDPPQGEAADSSKAQILTSFKASITDPTEVEALASELQSFRWISSNNTDGKLMYGAEAALLSYVDIPLGGDVSRVELHTEEVLIREPDEYEYVYNSFGVPVIGPDGLPLRQLVKEGSIVGTEQESYYTWDPQFVGKILIPFPNPTPVTNDSNATGKIIQMGGSDAGKRDEYLNAYFASFYDRTTFAMGVQEQYMRSEDFSSLGELKPETVTMGTVSAMPTPDNLSNLSLGGDAGEAEGQGPGGAIDQEEFAPDLGTKLPSLEFELGDYATLVMDGYNVGFTIGFPVFQKEETTYASDSSTATTSDGCQKTTGINEDGNEFEHIESADKKKITDVETVIDPNNPNKRVKTIKTVTTDDQGNKTYRNETRTQEKRGDKWVGVSKEVNTNAPATPSNAQPASLNQQARENFKETSGWNTLTEFCNAVKSGNRDKLKKMANGKMEDDTFAKAKNGANKCRKVEVNFSVQLAIMFEYNPIDNCHYFKSAGVSATLGVEFTAQARIPACPAFYVYLKLGVEVEAAISMSCYRQVVEGDEITKFVKNSPKEIQEGKKRELVFALDMRESELGARGFHMNLAGSVYMEVYDKQDCTGTPLTLGCLSGDGSQKEVIFEPYNKMVYVRLEAKGDTWPVISEIKPVLRAESKVVFDGLSITPSLSMEVGAGVGVELVKAEIFLKTSVAITMTMGGYLEETDGYEGFYISNFDWNIALGIHLTFLFVNFDMDLIAFGVEGAQNGTGGYFTWDISASSFNGLVPIWSKTVYTTAGGKTLDGEPPEPYGVNLHRNETGIIFRNSNGELTNTSDNAGNGESWGFYEKVSAWRWGGGVFSGEIPLNADLAKAKTDGATVTFTTDEQEIDIYFDGEITVKSGTNTKTYTDSPANVKLNGEGAKEVTITAEDGTYVDRYCVPDKTRMANFGPIQTSADGQSIVRVSKPVDISAVQKVNSAFADPNRAIPATATDDFMLSGYNTSGDAKKLVSDLATGYTYQVGQAGDNIYVVFPLMLSGAPQLVLSRLVMTGDLNGAGTGMVHPLNPTDSTPYLVLDGDGLTDLDFNVQGEGDELVVTWVSYGDETESSYSVKRRTLDAAANAVGDVELLGSSEAYRFAPAQNGSTVIWAEAAGDAEAANAMLKAWLLAANPGLTGEMLDQVSVADSRYANAVFFWATQSRFNQVYGSATTLQTASGQTATVSGSIENLETVEIDGRTYVLYTTAEPAYFDTAAETPVTVSLEGIDVNTERGTVYRLYLRTVDETGFGTAKLLQTIIDFQGCTENNIAESLLKDGVYANSARIKTQADPYFANLRFVTADIDGTGVQTLGLFEMGGNSYLISENDIRNVCNGANGAELIPIFNEATGTEVNIGSDGTNLAAVFTAPMANSQSNAIYVAWWDVNLKTWGAPTVLAMRNLQVYEDGIKYDLNGEELEKAYLGQTTGNEEYDAYIASLDAHAREEVAGSMDKLVFSNLQMAARSVERPDGIMGKQLIVLTEGAMTKLKEFSFDMGEGKDPFVSVVPDGDSKVGFYAIAFGAGDQAVSETNLSFNSYDFSIGRRLIGELSFTNTGTVAIRGSESNPATVQLMAGSQQIATWHLTQPVASGQTIRLTFESLPLSDTLAAGTTFSMFVTEDAEYISSLGGTPFQVTVDNLLTVEEKPELSFGEFEVSFDSIQDQTAVLNFYASVLNNGSGDAEEVFLQFSYGTGEQDENGREIYRPIDITGSSFTTSEEEEIRGQAVTENFAQGVYRLKDQNGKTNLSKSHYRVVEGSLHVPVTCFAELEEYSGLHLRAEIFSDADRPDLLYGVYSSDHEEYNESNNRGEATVKHQTVFNMPNHIVTALGTTLTMPVSFVSTSANPDIVLTEITDGTEDWSPRMGICYYDPERRVIVAAPNSTAQEMLDAGEVPTGILQVKDQATNTIYAITYRVGSMADGVNIYRDDASFRFRDANGAETDLYAAVSENPGWLFMDWTVGWAGDEPGKIPMNNDLAKANQDGAWFTFDTVASSMEIYFAGELTVSSSFNDYATSEHFTDSPAVITFRDNDGNTNSSGEMHTVKVTADAKGTLIDRYVATYEINPVADFGPEAPQILWNRSFPETASVETGDSVPMTCYILDASGLQSVRFNGETLTEETSPKLVKLDENLWYFDYSFTGNGSCQVRAIDNAGNSSKYSVPVNWFNDVLTVGALADAPALNRNHLRFVDGEGTQVNTTSGTLRQAPYLNSTYAPGAGETSSAYLFENSSFSDTALAKLDSERWLAKWNGWYQVRVDRNDGTWARAILPLRNLDLSTPTLRPDLEGDGTPGSPYLIGSSADWEELGSYVSNGGETAGLHFLQTADFETDKMVGLNVTNPFSGVYNGGGHTLIFTANTTEEDCAPFRYVRDAAFCNLHTAGSITTSAKFAAGLCARSYGSVSLENCRSSVRISSAVEGDGTHGGFIAVGQTDGNVRFTGCVFDGAFLGSATTSCGGFVGCSSGNLSFRDCVMAASAFEFTDSQNFFRVQDSTTGTMENCYYLDVAADAQGTRGWAILAGEGVRLSFGSETTDYDTAGVAAFTGKTGLQYNGVFYTGAGKTAAFVPSLIGLSTGNLIRRYEATSGTLTETDAGYEIQMTAQDTTIQVNVLPLLQGEGTASSPYLIGSERDWNTLADYTNGGYLRSGQSFRQIADISVSTMVGTADAPFRGSYLGGGYTLTVALNSTDYYTAPFSVAEGVTIESLKVSGTVNGDMHCAGLVGSLQGENNRITDCLVEADIITAGTHCGGIVGHGRSSAATLEGCAFTGSIQGGRYVGVLWGWSDDGAQVSIVNCLEAGSEYTGTNVNPVGLGDTTERSIVNTYFTHGQKGNPARNWTGAGKMGYQVIPGEHVALDFGTGTAYLAAKLTAYPVGLSLDGSFLAGSGEAVTLTPGYSGSDPDNAESVFLASAGTFTAQNESWTLVMPAEAVTINIAGHEWGDPSYVWSDDNGTVTASRYCQLNTNHVDSETVASESVVTRPATCTEAGETTYTAVFANPAFETQTKAVDDIPALGHDWSEVSYVWNGLESVTATRTCQRDPNHVETETAEVVSVVTKPAACTVMGETTYTATFTNPAFKTQTKTLEDVPALGHEWGEPEYSWNGVESVTAVRICQHDASHSETETVSTTAEVTKPATCTENGETTYTASFENPAFGPQTKTVADIPAIGHSYQLSGWTWDGYSTAKANFVCANDPAHTLSLDAEITVVRTEPNCETAGQAVYTATVTLDGRIYTDQQTEVLPALGHAYELLSWSWYGYTKAFAIFSCQNDSSHVVVVDAVITEVRTEPTAEENGQVVYTASLSFEGVTYTDEKTEILPALGHDYELTGWTWEGYAKATAFFTDKNGGDPISVEAAIRADRTEPDCENEGRVVYTASVTLGDKTYTDTKTEVLAALGHDWGEASYTWAEDYSTVTASVTCRRDETHVLTETANAEYILTKPSTYKEEGIGTYRAAFENELFAPQTVQVVIPAIACDGGEDCPSARFTDLPGPDSWMHIPVDWAVVNKVTAGTGPSTFGTNNECTRSQFVMLLWRTMGSPEPESTENPFRDVREKDYFYKAVLWAVENGITGGVSDGVFGSKNACTRAQIVTFLWRMEGSQEPAGTENPFEDVKSGAYYEKAVLWAVEAGFTGGTSETTFSPNRVCTRVEAVTFLYREFAK